jgi:hypothetical protein
MTSGARSTVNRGFAGALGAALAAVATLAAGCGDTSPSGSPADDFVGTWFYNEVLESVVQCPNADPLIEPPDPNKIFAHGTFAPLVDLSPSPILPGVFCDLGFSVSNGIATAVPDQTCALTALDNFTIDVGADGAPLWTVTLNGPTSATEVAQATVHFNQSGKASTCSWNLAAHLTRVSKD